MLRSMSDSLIIPFNVTDYASTLDTLWKTLQAEQGAMMKSKLTNYNDLTAAITKFSDETEAFEERIAKVNKNDPLAVRAVNDQLLLLEKAFLDPTGLPGRNGKKHLLMAESSTDAYAGSSFPGLVDLMFEIDKAPDVDARWEEVKKHFSAVIYTVEAASNQLRDVIKFIPEE